MATDWSLTRTRGAMKETLNPIDMPDRADAHEAEVRGSMVDIESLSLQEMFDEEETEAGTIGKMTTRTAAGGGRSIHGLLTNHDTKERMH